MGQIFGAYLEAVAFTHLADIFIQSDIAFKVDFFCSCFSHQLAEQI